MVRWDMTPVYLMEKVGYNPCTNHFLTSWDIQVGGVQLQILLDHLLKLLKRSRLRSVGSFSSTLFKGASLFPTRLGK